MIPTPTPDNKDDMRQYVGVRIKAFRMQKGLTQSDLAQLAGYETFQAIALIEKGERGITLDKLELIANGLGVSMEELLPTPAGKSPALADVLIKLRSDKAGDSATEKSLIDFAKHVDEKFGKKNI